MPAREAIARALELLGDREFVVENLPGVVGLRGDRIVVEFRRWLFRYRDSYLVSAAHDSGLRTSEVVLEGERSRLRIVFRPTPLGIDSGVEYEGPRARIVMPVARRMARGLARAALEEAERLRAEEEAREEPGGLVADVSASLADIGWLADLLMRSTLVGTVEVEMGPGSAGRIVEAASRHAREYEAVYMSGRTPGGAEVRVLIAGGRVVGAYARLPGGGEELGPRALEIVEGRVVFRVYGVLSLPRASGLEVRSSGGAEAAA